MIIVLIELSLEYQIKNKGIMNKLNHTKGSWDLTTGITDYTISGVSVQVAIVNKDTAINPEEARANAKLIAAAPDMLEVLQESLVQLERFAKILPDSAKFDMMAQSLDNHFEAVRSVIDKATK